MLFRSRQDTKVVEGFLSEYSIKEPPQSWRCKTVTNRTAKHGRFNYVKKQIIAPLHPPVIRSNGELYLYEKHDNIHEYRLTNDFMERVKRNENRIVLVNKEQQELLKNRYVKLRCKVENKDGVEYLKIVKVLSKKKQCNDKDIITLGLEINFNPKVDNPELFSKFMLITLEKLCNKTPIEEYEFEKCYYAQIKDDYFIHYKEPYTLGIYSRVDGLDKNAYNKCSETIGKIHDLFRKHIDLSVDFKYNFVSDKDILLAGIK